MLRGRRRRGGSISASLTGGGNPELFAGSSLLRPTGQASASGWTKTNGAMAEWEHVDDAVTRPTAPSTVTDYISGADAIIDLTFGSVNLTRHGYVTSVVCQVFGYFTAPVDVYLKTGETVLASELNYTALEAWDASPLTYTGELDQAQLDDLHFVVDTSASNTGTTRYLECVYLDVNHMAPA